MISHDECSMWNPFALTRMIRCTAVLSEARTRGVLPGGKPATRGCSPCPMWNGLRHPCGSGAGRIFAGSRDQRGEEASLPCETNTFCSSQTPDIFSRGYPTSGQCSEPVPVARWPDPPGGRVPIDDNHPPSSFLSSQHPSTEEDPAFSACNVLACVIMWLRCDMVPSFYSLGNRKPTLLLLVTKIRKD